MKVIHYQLSIVTNTKKHSIKNVLSHITTKAHFVLKEYNSDNFL